MGDLYFIEYPDKLTYTYSRRDDGTWRMSRLAPCQHKKLVWVLLYNKDKASWIVQDQSPGSKSEVLGRPVVAADLIQSPDYPPLGQWRFSGYACEVTNRMPVHPGMDPLPEIYVPFATMRYSEEGNIARLDTKVNNTTITDEALEELLKRLAEVVKNLATRPAMILLLHSDGNDAAMPSFSQIRRFLAWIQENGPELFLVGRGSAIVMKPRGLIGHALVNVVRMVQRLLPPPWPEAIVNTSEEAEAFLEEHSRQYREDVMGQFNQKLVNGAVPEAELNSKQPSADEGGIGNRYLKAQLQSVLPKKFRADSAKVKQPTIERSISEPTRSLNTLSNNQPQDLQRTTSAMPRIGQAEELPLGWEFAWSDDHKRFYYFNRATGAVSWNVPEAAEAEWLDIPTECPARPIRILTLWRQGGAARLQDGTTRSW